jgi:hypothetical protein
VNHAEHFMENVWWEHAGGLWRYLSRRPVGVCIKGYGSSCMAGQSCTRHLMGGGGGGGMNLVASCGGLVSCGMKELWEDRQCQQPLHKALNG